MKKLMMNPLSVLAVLFISISAASAQSLQKGLLWEITGNGLAKPSYLYGTMHVSSKLAFNLSDSFFIAIKNSDRVALETSPENWLEEFMTTEFMGHMMRVQSSGPPDANNPITISDYTWFKEFYAKEYIKIALSKDPNMLNQLMFRHTGNKQDFEEDTYLDLYIFQTASKLRKPVVSAEGLDESLKLVMQAYTNMYPEDKERKYNPDFDKLLEEYYRQADLDRMDSLMQKQGYSETYLENMLYIRNRNMVASMDSFMRLGPLFTGVGAAHLPGEQGVINLLRSKGYTVRAVHLGQRNASVRNKIDKVEVPITYQKFTSVDGVFNVDVPGKLIVMPDNAMNQQYLYTDMMNGSFYTVSRIKTLAPFLGYSDEYLKKSVDSLLYEYIPGTTLSMKPLEMNGYKGYDIVNRTRRGDLQYYRIVFTPVELFVAKTGGRGNYVKKNGLQFIRSFTVNRPNATAAAVSNNKDGFEITLPAQAIANFEPSALSNYAPNTHIYQCIDQENHTSYFMLKQTKINSAYLEEDSVELNLVERGFTEGTGLTRTSREYKGMNGFPYLTCTYSSKEKDKYMVAVFSMKGAQVYAFSAWCNTEVQLEKARQTLATFSLIPSVSPEASLRTDTIHKFTVMSPVPVPPDINSYNFSFRKREEKNNYTGQNEYIGYSDAATGERVLVRWQRLHKYFMSADTAKFWESELEEMNPGERMKQQVTYYNKDGAMCADIIYTDTNSSRVVLCKEIVKGRYIYTLEAVTDSVTMGNNFVRDFFTSFHSTDTSSQSVFTDRTQELLNDLVSEDSATYAQARELVGSTQFKGKSYKRIAETIGKLKEDKYKKDLRIELVAEIGFRKDAAAIPYLKAQYTKAGDDYNYQLAILKALAAINSKASYQACKDLLIEEPPFSSDNYMYYRLFDYISSGDSAWNRRLFLPDVLKLADNDEYKIHVYSLLAEAIDSNKIAASAYQPYLGGIINDARKAIKQELTKDEEEHFNMNQELDTYNKILIGQYDKNAQVREYFEKQLKAKNFHVKSYALAIMLANKKPVQDSMINNLAENVESRIDFYYALRDYGQESYMPKAFAGQEMLAYCFTRNMVNPVYGDNKLDTLVLVDTAMTYFHGKTGRVYFYKYRLKKSDDWRTYTTGMLDDNPEQFMFVSRINAKGQKVFDEQGNVQEQFSECIEASKEAARNNRLNNGYNFNFDYDGDD